MDYDLLIKIVPLILGAAGAAKIFFDISIGKRSKLRDEYKFAKDFFEELNGNKTTHPYLREKGYQAISGDNQLKADEVAYLLSLREPEQALQDYVRGKNI